MLSESTNIDVRQYMGVWWWGHESKRATFFESLDHLVELVVANLLTASLQLSTTKVLKAQTTNSMIDSKENSVSLTF